MSPLTCAGLRRDALYALFFAEESLRDGGVGFVAAGWAHAFIFVVNPRWCIERFFKRGPDTVDSVATAGRYHEPVPGYRWHAHR